MASKHIYSRIKCLNILRVNHIEIRLKLCKKKLCFDFPIVDSIFSGAYISTSQENIYIKAYYTVNYIVKFSCDFSNTDIMIVDILPGLIFQFILSLSLLLTYQNTILYKAVSSVIGVALQMFAKSSLRMEGWKTIVQGILDACE